MVATRTGTGTTPGRDDDDGDDGPGEGTPRGASRSAPTISLDGIMAAIQSIQQKLTQQDDKFRAFERGSGPDWAVHAADDVPRCAADGCSRPVYIESDGHQHPFCGRTCAISAGALRTDGGGNALGAGAADNADSRSESSYAPGAGPGEAGIDPTRRSALPDFDARRLAQPGPTQVAQLWVNREFSTYMRRLHENDPSRAVLVEDLLGMHEHLQLTLDDITDPGVRMHLAPLRQKLETILDAHVIFPSSMGGSQQAHANATLARRAFAEPEEAILYFGTTARHLEAERQRKAYEQACTALTKPPAAGERTTRGTRGGGRRQQQQQQQQPQGQRQSAGGQRQQQQPAPSGPEGQRQARGRASRSPSTRGGRTAAASGAAASP